MERTSIDPRRSKHLPWFEDNRTTGQHNADYLKRLSKLRDELINQEQANLSNALERLHQRQNGNNGSNRGYRPRETQSYCAEPSNKKSFMTTVEHFKRTRPQRSPPRIMPLEGKQIMEPNFSFKSQSDKDTLPGMSTGSARTADESFKLNLQRLIQPTSSIPNIGRKCSNPDKQFVLDTSPLTRKDSHNKSSMYSSTSVTPERGSPYKGLYKSGGHFKDLVRMEDMDLSHQPTHYDASGDQDRLNMEQLKDYYCIYYLPTNTPIPPEDESYYDDSSYISCRKSDVDSSNKMFTSIEGRSILKPIDQSQRRSNGKPRKSRGHINHNKRYYGDGDRPVKNGRRRIVVDMPAIVFNSASPSNMNARYDVEREPTLLRKEYKQNEIRQREVKKLIEDVKELNMRNEQIADRVSKSQGSSNI